MELREARHGARDSLRQWGLPQREADHRIEIARFRDNFVSRFLPPARPDLLALRGSEEEQPHEPHPVGRLGRPVGQQQFAHGREQPPAVIGAAGEPGAFELARRAAFLRCRLAVAQDRAAVGIGHSVRQERHQPDQAMRRARRIERGEGKAERERAGSSCGRWPPRVATCRRAGRSSRRRGPSGLACLRRWRRAARSIAGGRRARQAARARRGRRQTGRRRGAGRGRGRRRR